VEPWERIFWSSSPAFLSSTLHFGREYALSDLRVVIRSRGRVVQEIALDDITAVRLEQNWYQRLAATSTVRIRSRRAGRELALRNIHHGPQLALILQLLATDRFSALVDAEFVSGALGPEAPHLLRPNQGLLAAATLAFVLIFVVVGIARHDTLAPVTYGADDPIAPDGHRRSTAQIMAFMEAEVMPFARRALAPVVGGPNNVKCETCHGDDAEARNWKMPGVRALPEPEVRWAGMEHAGVWLDPQMRNAVYGYLADGEKLRTAAYMRGIVMPGMAKVMHRPPYDFTKSYGYNRAHVAVGCYHCHLVE
jgi:PH (Pleckstrin Homology) domain-containing protein